VVGTTGRLDALQAAVLERKLLRLDGWNADRRRVAHALRAGISAVSDVTPPPSAPTPADHVYHQFVVTTDERDALREHLGGHGVATAIHYPVPIHRSDAFREFAGDGERDVAPVATMLAEQICSLPIFPGMRDSQVEQVVDAVAAFVAR
jgi:dTDP-3-amino-3,4,6-trideoxy-alpha-D-glucose transaminase